MSEEKLNEKLIKFEIQEICRDCVHLDKIVPIIREMLSEEYKTGLEQARFDKRMLELENDRLAVKLNKNKILQNEFRKWLENESKELIRDAGYHQRICLDILEKYKEIIGGKDEKI